MRKSPLGRAQAASSGYVTSPELVLKGVLYRCLTQRGRDANVAEMTGVHIHRLLVFHSERGNVSNISRTHRNADLPATDLAVEMLYSSEANRGPMALGAAFEQKLEVATTSRATAASLY